MKTAIKYADWPSRVKIPTALATEKFHSKGHNLPIILGYFLIAGGIGEIIYRYLVSGNELDSKLLTIILFEILIGVATTVSGYANKWIANNSSWDERFANKSSTFHKAMYLLVSALIILGFVLKYIDF